MARRIGVEYGKSEYSIDEIQIGPGRRAVNPERVAALAESIKLIGLKTPITIRMAPWLDPEDGHTYNTPFLVAGLHRLEAHRSLGLENIQAVKFDGDERDARLWEIAENLHRSDLTVLERSEHVAEWVRLTRDKVLQSATPSGGAQPAEGGIRKAARELGIETTDVHRSVKVDGLTDEAKAAARETGLDDNQSALLEASRAEPSRQATVLRERDEARKLNKEHNDAVADVAAEEFAGWLARHVAPSEMHTIISWLEGTKPKAVIKSFRRLMS